MLRLDTAYANWELIALPKADSSYRFDALDAYAVVARELGPVLLVGQLSTASVALLEKKLTNQTVIQWCSNAEDSTSIYSAMLDLIRRHKDGQPEIPRRLAVALMLLAKLERMHYWGGNAKTFMSVHKLAKGNGVDEIYKDVAHSVAEYLSSDKRKIRLMSDKLGDGSPKYACNSDERANVYKFLRTWTIDDERVTNWLGRDDAKVSVRELDAIRATNYDTSRPLGPK